jgi:hypothetical protein
MMHRKNANEASNSGFWRPACGAPMGSLENAAKAPYPGTRVVPNESQKAPMFAQI